MAAEATDAVPGPGPGRRPPSSPAPDGRAAGPAPSARRAGRASATRFRGPAGRLLTLAGVLLLAAAGVRWARAASRGPLAAVPALAADSAATLLVVLRPSDCDSYRPLVAAWDRLHRRGRVRVVGAVVDGPEAAGARDSLERRLGVGFPVRHDLGDDAERLALRLGYGVTPLSVLLDRRGRPRAVVPPAPGRGRAEAASRAAGAHLELLGDGGSGP